MLYNSTNSSKLMQRHAKGASRGPISKVLLPCAPLEVEEGVHTRGGVALVHGNSPFPTPLSKGGRPSNGPQH